MKTTLFKNKTLGALATALLLGGALNIGQAQTFLTGSYTNSFENGGKTSPFAGSGSVYSWIYWYNVPGGNIGITNDVHMDAGNNPTSGSLYIVNPFTTQTQNVFFGTFGNQYPYDISTQANLLLYSTITFDIRVASNSVPDAAGDFGTIGTGELSSTFSYEEFGRVTIPGAATNGWIHMSVNIDYTALNLTNAAGIGFDYNSWGGYPIFPADSGESVNFWIDNLEVHLAPEPAPPALLAVGFAVALFLNKRFQLNKSS
jgi:hypothetical protein